jgi:hypothetical protein
MGIECFVRKKRGWGTNREASVQTLTIRQRDQSSNDQEKPEQCFRAEEDGVQGTPPLFLKEEVKESGIPPRKHAASDG